MDADFLNSFPIIFNPFQQTKFKNNSTGTIFQSFGFGLPFELVPT